MAKAGRATKRSFGSRLLGLINPIRDPSLLVALILTVIWRGNPLNSPALWALFAVLIWMAVKAFIWLLVNFTFSFVYLTRKGSWVLRHPRLAWRLLEALGTEEIIIGGLRPEMFATEEGGLHEGQMGLSGLAGAYAGGYNGMLSGPAYPRNSYEEDQQYDDYAENGYNPSNGYYDREPRMSGRLDEQSAEVREMLAAYSKLLSDWMGFTEEKWRAISDSQLGWKPLRGRWNGWEEIYRDSFTLSDGNTAADPMGRRFDNSQTKGSAASAVACFMHDLDSLRQSLAVIEGGEAPQAAPRLGGMNNTQQPVSGRTNKSPIIRNPMIVDADH